MLVVVNSGSKTVGSMVACGYRMVSCFKPIAVANHGRKGGLGISRNSLKSARNYPCQRKRLHVGLWGNHLKKLGARLYKSQLI